jgi:hypothetical protein
MKIESTPLHEAKARCETCWKVLDIETNSIITQAVIDRITHQAEQHEMRHPKHKVEVMIYDKAPETVDLGI